MGNYLQLSDYGLIGNKASTALVSRLGSIDWCCFPHLDSPSHFGSLLDENRGGRFQLMPQGGFRSDQSYLQRTHVLQTVFETPHGRAILTDWMPMGDRESADPIIYRRVDVLQGKVAWLIVCTPRFDYGRWGAQAEVHRGGILFRGPHPDHIVQLRGDVPLEISANGSSAVARFTLEAGQSAHFAWAWGRRVIPPAFQNPRATIDFWQGWAHRCTPPSIQSAVAPASCLFSGPWHDSVTRSALTLKLLMTASIGSIAEAVTTSLPGTPGDGRTYDYRYAWIRDGALAMQAFANLGYRNECDLFFAWLTDIITRDGAEGLQPVYRLDGGKLLPELELDFLSGYQGTRPVRVGNSSASQFQLDIFGHVMLAASEYYRTFGAIPADLWPKLADIADYVCQAWRRPDHGPWEMRLKPEHFVSSKVLCWAALDRAIWLADHLRQRVLPRWHSEREILRRLIESQGYDEQAQTFIRSFGDLSLDASVLVIPLVGFLPFDHPRVQSTIRAIQNRLSDGVLVRRYEGDDGLPATESAHLISSFLHTSCLALSGQVDEAGDRLAELCGMATPLGLFGEQVDIASGETTGNFPSAAVHVSLINAALYVGAARGNPIPLVSPLGMRKTELPPGRIA